MHCSVSCAQRNFYSAENWDGIETPGEKMLERKHIGAANNIV